MANVSASVLPVDTISRLLGVVGQPARILILFVISEQEACVCHLEAALGMRQASISQHLMALRKAGLVTTNRDGRNIFYRLVQPEVITLLRQAAKLVGFQPDELLPLTLRPVEGCPCPQCNSQMDSSLSCANLHPNKTK